MIQQAMISMLGDYAKYVTPLGNGRVRINIPNNLDEPSFDDITTVDLETTETIELINLCLKNKQYQIGDKIVSEGDKDFNMNKWASLAIENIKNK